MKNRMDLYELFRQIRRRPAMYLGTCSILRLRDFLSGCHYMMMRFEIQDDTKPDFQGFHDWVAQKFGWRESTAGWANIILAETDNDEAKALDRFWELVEEYQASASEQPH